MSPNAPKGQRAVRMGCYFVLALLYVASVPWYRDVEAPLVLWFGLPDWVAVALFCYVGVAVVNAVAWLATDVPDDVYDHRDSDRAPGPVASGRRDAEVPE